MRRTLVRTALALLFVVIAWYCYHAGKAYNLLIENLPYEAGGMQQPAIEAVNVYFDGKPQPLLVLEGDRLSVTLAGLEHTIKIDMLDLEDKVLGTREIGFHIDDLGTDFAINVARAYTRGIVK